MKISEVLKLAKVVLMERGWCQGDYTNHVGEVCIMGAVNVVEDGDPTCDDEDSSEETEIEKLLHYLALRDWYRDMGSWNDAPHRTPEEVLAFMDRAIALAEERELRQAADAVGEAIETPVTVHAR